MMENFSAPPPNDGARGHGGVQTREFIPSMSNFVDDEGGSVYGTGNFLMFSGTENGALPLGPRPLLRPPNWVASGLAWCLHTSFVLPSTTILHY